MTGSIKKSIILKLTLLALLALGWTDTQAGPGSTNAPSTNRILVIDPSSMPIDGGTATLTIGVLHRADGVYSGDYKVKVSPYFFKSEKGTLAIAVSDESMAKINQGKVAAITGTATTRGQGGTTRHVDATATPDNLDHGTIKLWFMAGDKKMIFEPAYHFSEKGLATILAQTKKPGIVCYLQRGHFVPHYEDPDAIAQSP